VVAALVLSGPWMMSQLVQFTTSIFAAIARM
jgi:flagellar biosynthesis protein FliQ